MNKTLLMSIALIVLFSCGKERDIDKIGDAQLCMDELGASASASEVDECLTRIEGLESTAAYSLRCAGSFMKEGFLDPTKLTSAIEELESSGTANFMSLITFTSANDISSDTSNAYAAFEHCLKAEGKASTLFASFGYIAMSLYQYMDGNDGGNDCVSTPGATGYAFDTCAAAWAANPLNFTPPPGVLGNLLDASAGNPSTDAVDVQTSIGSVMVSTYNVSCMGRVANVDLCDKLKTAIDAAGGTSDARAVAVKFFQTSLF